MSKSEQPQVSPRSGPPFHLPMGRRQLLVGMVSAAALVAAGCKNQNKGRGGGGGTTTTSGGGTTTTTTTTGPMGPGSGWTGAAGSGYGGAPPADPARTTAKPAVQWWTPPGVRFASDMVIGVDADALGGVAYVDFYVEGTTQRVTQTLFTDTDVNGNPRARLGYWITLSNSAFLAKTSTGAANIYAVATANDATMQPRVIGPLLVYPRSTQFDWVKQVPTDYGTLRVALDALAAAISSGAVECGSIELQNNGTYEGGSPAAGLTGVSGKGFSRIWASPGVTATIVRGSSFDPYNTTGGAGSAWDWWPGVNNLEFYGSGVVLDARYFRQIRTASTTVGLWFNGSRLTNSAGRNTLYWNKSAPPQFCVSANSMADVPTYWTDATVENVNAPFGTHMVAGCKINGTLSTTFFNTMFIANNYVANTNTSFYRQVVNALSIQYGGTASTASVSKDFASSGKGSLYLYAGGSLVKRYDFWDMPGQSGKWFNISDIVNDINTLPGWSASLLDDSRNATAIGGSGQTFSNLDVKSKSQTIGGFYDFHDEWVHYLGSVENVIVRGNNCRNSFYSTSFFNPESGANTRDMIVKANQWENGGAGSGSTSGFPAGSHFVFFNNFLDGNAAAPNTPTSGPGGLTTSQADAYSLCAQNIFAGGVFSSTSSWPSYPPFKDNVIIPGWVGMPAGPNDTGNIKMSDVSTLATCFTSKSTGDYRPAGPLLNNLKPRLDPWDGRDNGRASNDAIGAWASGYTAPTYPF